MTRKKARKKMEAEQDQHHNPGQEHRVAVKANLGGGSESRGIVMSDGQSGPSFRSSTFSGIISPE